MTEGFEVAQPLRVRAGRLLERSSHTLVKLGPSSQQEVLVHHLVHERVREAISRFLVPLPQRLHQIGLGELLEHRVDGARLGRDGSKQRTVERRPEHGRFLKQPPRRRGQAVDPREQKPMERRWDDRLGHRGAGPPAPLAMEQSSAHQAAHDLLDEERIAARPGGDEVWKLREVCRRAEEARHEGAHLVRGERSDPDDGLGGSGHQRRLRIRPVREQHDEWPLRQLVDHLAQQVDRGGVGPVEVLDQEEQRLALEAPLDQRPCGQRDLALELLGLDVGVRLALEAEHVAQHRRDRRRLVVPRAARIRFAKERAEDAVRRLAERGACGAAQGDARQSSVGLQPCQELRDEPRLACAGLTDEAHELRAPALHPIECGQELTELVGSPDERRG